MRALGILSMSFDLAAYLWPLTIAIAVAGFFGIRSLVQLRKLATWQTQLVLACLGVAFVIVPIYAGHFWADHAVHTPETQEAPTNGLVAIQALFFIVLAVSIAFARGFRLSLAGLSLLVAWLGIGVFFTSTMAVSGVWL
jgi:hypothetical protein